MKTFKIILTIYICLILSLLNAQSVRHEWVQDLAYNAQEPVIDTDSQGNVVMVDSFRDSVLANHSNGKDTLYANGEPNVYVLKYGANSNLLWAKRFEGANFNLSGRLQIDKQENILVSGTYTDTVDFDPGPDTFQLEVTEGFGVFLTKLSSSGNFSWATQIEIPDSSFLNLNSIATDDSGNIYLAGEYRGEIDFDPGTNETILTSTTTFFDGFILKLDSTGDFIWVKTIAGISSETFTDIDIDHNGDLVCIGYCYSRSVDLDPGPGEYIVTPFPNTATIFYLKLDRNGKFIWADYLAKSMPIEAFPFDLELDETGALYILGTFSGEADFDPGPDEEIVQSKDYRAYFVQKLDESGNFKWVKQFGYNAGKFSISSFSVDQFQQIYLTGAFESRFNIITPPIDFNPNNGIFNLEAELDPHIHIIKLDTDGNFYWAKKMGGYPTSSNTYALGQSISSSPTGDLFLSGSFYGTVDFDPGSNNAIAWTPQFSGTHAFLQKFTPCTPDYTVLDTIVCNQIFWIDGYKYDKSSDSIMHILYNSQNCDSIILLNLDIKGYSTITSGVNTLTANNSNGTYQWLDCNRNYAPIKGETNQTLITSGGNYAVEVTEDGCVDTSDCVTIDNSVGINELNPTDLFNIYPNPTDGNFSIQFNQILQEAEITITDVNGRMVLRQVAQNKAQVELELDEPAGIYFVKVETQTQNQATRIVLR